MQQFKKNARAILSTPGLENSGYVENLEYRQNAMSDIVSAYKSLKSLLTKA